MTAATDCDLRYDARMVLTAEQLAVADANEAFYEALTRRDLTAMERLWFPADWVECIHPGMSSIRGWDADDHPASVKSGRTNEDVAAGRRPARRGRPPKAVQVG